VQIGSREPSARYFKRLSSEELFDIRSRSAVFGLKPLCSPYADWQHRVALDDRRRASRRLGRGTGSILSRNGPSDKPVTIQGMLVSPIRR
jgi:hypothetical protein